MADNGLLFAKLLEGLSGGAVEGIKYKNTRDAEERKRKAEEEMKKILLDRQVSQEDFTRKNTLFDNTLALEKAKQGTTALSPDGTEIYRSQPLDPNVSSMLDRMLRGEAPTSGIVPTAGVQSPSVGIVPPQPQAAPSPAFIGDQPPTFLGKVVSAKQPDTNVSAEEFNKNPGKYRSTPNLKVVPSPATSTLSASPESQLEAVRHMKDLLTKIPTSLSTSGTAIASKVLGGERNGFGSDAIRQYEDEKPGVAVGLYRTLTGDTRLSDADAEKRAVPFLPRVFPVPDTETVRGGKISRIEKALQLRAKNPNKEIVFEELMRQAGQESSARLEFNSEAEVPDNLPIGTVIYIGGRKAVIE